MNLERCPMCKYDLAGLPARHACPECGFAYDADTWIHEVPTNTTIATIACVSSAFVALAMLRKLVLSGSLSDAGIFVLFASNTWLFWRTRNRPEVRLLVSREICSQEENAEQREWRWTDIADVQRKPGWINHLVTIIDRDGRKYTFMRTPDRARADAMVTRMRARLQEPLA